MGETLNPTVARPPQWVRVLRTVAAVLLVVTNLSYVFRILSVWNILNDSMLDTSYAIVSVLHFIAFAFLATVASDKSSRIAIIGIFISMLFNTIVNVTSNIYIQIISVLLSLLQIYFWTVIFRNEKLTSTQRRWTVLLFVLLIHQSIFKFLNISELRELDIIQSAIDFLSIYLDSTIEIIIRDFFLIPFIVIGWWKLCHSELFAGNYSATPAQPKIYSPLNKYTVAVIISWGLVILFTFLYNDYIYEFLNRIDFSI